MVGKEAAKGRSGREDDLSTRTFPSLRGGEVPQTLSDDEGVAAEDDRDVMMPASEAPSFEVVEPQLALHLFVSGLRTPALFDDAHELLLAHRSRQRRQRVLGRLLLAVGPFDEQPERLARRWFAAIV